MKIIEAMILLIQNKYIVENVRNHRQISAYVQNVIRHCNDVDLIIVSQQMN